MDISKAVLSVFSLSFINTITRPVYLLDLPESVPELFKSHFPDTEISQTTLDSLENFGGVVFLNEDGHFKSVFFSRRNDKCADLGILGAFADDLDKLIQESPEPTEFFFHPSGRNGARIFDVSTKDLEVIDINTEDEVELHPIDFSDCKEIYPLSLHFKFLRKKFPLFQKKVDEFTNYLKEDDAVYSLAMNLRSLTFFEDMVALLAEDGNEVVSKRRIINHLLYNPFRPVFSMKNIIKNFPLKDGEESEQLATEFLVKVKEKYLAHFEECADKGLAGIKPFIIRILQEDPELLEIDSLNVLHNAIISYQNWERINYLTALLEINKNHTHYPKEMTPYLEYALEQNWMVEHVSGGRREEEVGYSFTPYGARIVRILKIIKRMKEREAKEKIVTPEYFGVAE